MWDEGWSGRWVHRLASDDPPVDRKLTVHEGDDDTILYVIMDGTRFRICRKQRAGF